MVIDPICRLTVDESTERRAYFNGKTVYFCSERCREKFVSTPDAEKPKTTAQGISVHTCARHPELWQENPCDCPKCRMALEPAMVTMETNSREGSDPHDMTVRFRIAAALALTIFTPGRSARRG